MKKKINRKLKQLLSVVMIFGILLSSFPIAPFIPTVSAMSTVSGDKIIETAQTYVGWSYDEVGTCTGLVTRTLNKLGIGESVVGIHPYDIDKPQSSGGARYAPDAMYRNAMNHPEDAQLIWQGYKKDVEKNAKLFKNGDLIIERIQDKAEYTGTGHVSFMHIYGDTIASFGAGSAGIKDSVYATGVSFISNDPYGIMPINTPPWVNGNDYITVFRLTEVKPEYATLTSDKTANETVEVSFFKTDVDTRKPLSGVEVDFYRDDVKFASGTTDASGIARATSVNNYSATSSEKEYCTNYENLGDEGKAEVDSRGAYHSQVEAQAAADSEAQKEATNLASQTHRYSVVERKTKTKYWLNPDNTTDSNSATGSGSITLSLTNERVRGTATIVKEDYDVKHSQNEATLDGAVYGLYAKNNILDPADASVIYSAGQQITTVRIENGSAKVENLYLGDYFWKELSLSEGYTIDSSTLEFSLNYSDQNVRVVTSSSTSKEKVIVGDFEIEKVITSGEESEITQKEEGAEFLVVAKKYVDKYGSIEEAWEHRSEFTEKEYDKLITDKKGYDKTNPLAYGTFVVKQIKGKIDTENVKDTWEFKVTRENQETIKYIVNNRIFTSYVKLQKKDAESGKLITLSNTSFKIKNADTGEYLKQKVGQTTYDVWKTDDKGEFVLPLEVKAGNYILEELESPNLYVINKEGVSFKVTNSNIFETDPDGDPIITVVMKDKPVKGQVKVSKFGEVLVGVEETEDGNKQFKYEERSLAGMTVNIQTAEDIIDPADGSILYRKGEIVDTITTEKDKGALSRKLPLGKYVVYEVEAPDGMIIDQNQYEVTLEFVDNETEVVMDTVSITNERQKVELELVKLEEDTEIALEGVIFNLLATKDIVSYDGKVLVKANTVIEQGITDSEGKLVFNADLPISTDEETYFEIKEAEAKEGYYLNEDSYPVDTQYKGQNIIKISNSEVIYNKPIINYVRVNKVDDTTSENIVNKDFTFGLCKDSECNEIVEEYHANQEDGTTDLMEIRYGDILYIRELSAPEGYELSSEVVKVELNKDGLLINDELVEVDEELIYNFNYEDTPYRYILVNKIDERTTKNITNKDFTFGLCKDSECNEIVEEYHSNQEDGTAGLIQISSNQEFYIRELSAPEGYELSSEVIKVELKKDGLYINDELVETDDNFVYSFEYKNKPYHYVLVNKVDDKTGENIISKDFTFGLCKDSECNEIIKEYHANQEDGTALVDVPSGEELYIRELSAPEGYGLSSEVIRVLTDEEGLHVNGELVEVNEDLIYSFYYQDTLLPVVQTGYDDNMSLYIALGGISLAGLSIILLFAVKKSKKRK